MISPELLRRYPFFAGLSHNHLVTLAKAAEETSVEADHYFFHERDELECLRLVVQGSVAVIIEVPARDVEQKLSGQLMGEIKTRDVVISAIGPGEVFGWSALVSPYRATASAKATTPCRVIAINCRELRNIFAKDCEFGYLMMEKIAQLSRDRLHDTRIESLAHLAG